MANRENVHHELAGRLIDLRRAYRAAVADGVLTPGEVTGLAERIDLALARSRETAQAMDAAHSLAFGGDLSRQVRRDRPEWAEAWDSRQLPPAA